MEPESHPQTLRELGGLPTRPDGIAGAVIVVIDAQHEYLDGSLTLPDVRPAVDQIRRLLDAARSLGAPVIHVAHSGRPGGLFAPGVGGEIIEQVAPIPGETVIGKTFPNAFAGTELRAAIERIGDPGLVLCGFMTHMCVSSTARAALDLGLNATVVRDATATRSLPSTGSGGPIAAELVHEIALAELADRFSVVTDTATLLGDIARGDIARETLLGG
jgi:nicotinamidase-related amidase